MLLFKKVFFVELWNAEKCILAVCRIPLYSPEFTYPPSPVRTNQEAFQEIEGGREIGKGGEKSFAGKGGGGGDQVILPRLAAICRRHGFHTRTSSAKMYQKIFYRYC